jgi:hypothetical protein
VLRDRWGSLFGGSRTHHIVLLDDSYSMSDQWTDTSAWDQARQVVDKLAEAAGRQSTPQSFTLLRFSKADRNSSKGTQPDLLDEPLDSAFKEKLTNTLSKLSVSQTAAGPSEAIEAIEGLASKRDDENRIVYLVSDYRLGDWDDSPVLKKLLTRLDESGTQLQLINCVDAARPNLGVVALRPSQGTRAAGVPLLMEVAVRNFGAAMVRDRSVSISEDNSPRASVLFEDIPPGKTVVRKFPVLFTTAGDHDIVAKLDSDPVLADNSRYSVVNFSSAVPVLLIDGTVEAQDAYFISTAISPGGKINTGLQPAIEKPRYLRDHPLDKFGAIFVLNVERLDPAEIEALEAYAKAGGGVAFFVGEQSRADFYNRNLYRDGEGLFPAPLAFATDLLLDRLERAPDLAVTDHPVFSVFAGQRNSFINSVTIQRYFTTPKDWNPPADSTTKIIARLRNGAPLAVEKSFGDGRVFAFLTKASPVDAGDGSWNNWGRNNPSYVVALLELQAYLASARQHDETRLVGTPLRLQYTGAQYKPEVRFLTPGEKSSGGLLVDASSSKGDFVAELPAADSTGVYSAQLMATNGEVETRRYAFNVFPDEGDLQTIEAEQLASRLSGVRYEYHQAKDLSYGAQQLAGFNLGQSLMYLLIFVLLVEQFLAYLLSYHPPRLVEVRR